MKKCGHTSLQEGLSGVLQLLPLLPTLSQKEPGFLAGITHINSRSLECQAMVS